MRRKAYLLAGIAGALAAFPAQAQEEPTPENVIIVTATLRAADVQDVPLAVTAVQPAELQRQGIDDIKSLSTLSPSFNIQSSQTETQGTSIKIRGVGTTGNNTGLESSVGVFIDGVYQSRPGVALGDLMDLERLEVLRGPQGTLFGRNTSAGALNITTRRPSLTDVEGFANASYGNYDFFNVQGGIGVPVIQDVAAVRISGSYRRRDGFLESTTGGGKQQPRPLSAARPVLRRTVGRSEHPHHRRLFGDRRELLRCGDHPRNRAGPLLRLPRPAR